MLPRILEKNYKLYLAQKVNELLVKKVSIAISKIIECELLEVMSQTNHPRIDLLKALNIEGAPGMDNTS